MFFFPWYPALLLAVESNNVIDMRVRKVARSSMADARTEINLMINEKVAAAVQTTMMLMFGGSTAAVVDHYRSEVAANAARLTGPRADA